MKKCIGLLCCCLLAAPLWASRIKGVVVDARNGAPLVAVSVRVTATADQSQFYYTTTQNNGAFEIENVKLQSYTVAFNYLGYKALTERINLTDEGKDFGKVRLHFEEVELDAVQVTTTAVRAAQRGDTTEFNADAYKVTQDASAEDLIKKLPGISVENGTVKTQGEDVKKILVDGKPFFGDDPTIAIRNLSAEMIDKIEVFEKMSDQSQLTGFDDGEGVKAINIVTKKTRRIGQFGRGYAGAGYDDKQDEMRYTGGGNLNFFNSKRRVSIVGMTNNVNQQNFASEDMSAISGGGEGRRGRSLMGNSSGIATSHALGVNYSDVWGSKTEVTGSYFFNYTDKETEKTLTRNYMQQTDTAQRYNEASLSENRAINHRFNFRLDHKFNEQTSLLYEPSLNLQTNDGSSASQNAMLFGNQSLNASNNSNSNENSTLNLGSELLLRHKFQRQGRTFSAGVRGNISNAQDDILLLNQSSFAERPEEVRHQKSKNPTTNWNLRPNATYTEPLGEKSLLQLNYNLNYSFGESNKQTYNFDTLALMFTNLDSLYSNLYNNDYTTHRLGLSYRYRTEKTNASVGINYQSAQLEGEQTMPMAATTQRRFTSFLPNARYEYKFNKQQSFNLFYRANTNAPSVAQLQDVVNNSNPLLLTAGNPHLSQTYNQMLSLRYNQTTLEKGATFFAMLWGNAINHYITSNTITARRDTMLRSNNRDTIWLRKGAQFSRPVNVDGYFNTRAALNFGLPVSLLKSNLNIMTMGTYTRQPGFVDGEKNTSHNYSFTGGLILGSNISEMLDFNISYNATYNTAMNTLQAQRNSTYFRHNVNGRVNWIFWRGITFQGIAQYDEYRGLSEAYNEKYWRLDAGIGKKFLANNQAELRLMVYDILNQTKNYNRSVTENYIEDSLSKVLSRYFMLTFTYTLRNFGTPPARNNGEDGGNRPPPGRF